MTFILIKHRVSDYKNWKPVYDDAQEIATSMGQSIQIEYEKYFIISGRKIPTPSISNNPFVIIVDIFKTLFSSQLNSP